MGKLSSLLKLRPFLRKHWLIFWVGIIGMIMSSIAANPVPYLIGHVMDTVLIGKKSYNELYLYVGIIALLYLLRYGVSLYAKYMFVKINNVVVNEMRYSIMDKVIDLPMSYLAATEKGYVQSRIAECNSIGSMFSPSIVSVLLSGIDAVLAFATMFTLNYKLAIIVLALTPLFYLSSNASSRNFMKHTRDMMESSAVLNGECFEIISGIEDIKILNGKRTHLTKFQNKLRELVQNSMKQSKSMLLFMENIVFINNFGSLLVLLIAGIMILNGQFTIGMYTSFSLYIGKVFASTQGLATISATIKPVCLSIERIDELMGMEDENNGAKKYPDEKIETIKLENVSFQYKPDGRNVLDSLNFAMRKGEKILIKGDNGSGKSTLIKLLLGLYAPTEGRLLLNNRDAANIDRESIRARIGVVSQSIFMFRGTVLDNIVYGQNGKSREDVERLIAELHLEGYIDRLPIGLDTEISQNTAGVSGGQAQVIAFIRALLSDKDVIILDEPISNVDAETRDVMLTNLRERDFAGILLVVSHLAEGMNFMNRTINLETRNV
jgi:ATP-binding cassette subfamily C protein